MGSKLVTRMITKLVTKSVTRTVTKLYLKGVICPYNCLQIELYIYIMVNTKVCN